MGGIFYKFIDIGLLMNFPNTVEEYRLTKEHLESLDKYGIIPLHRMSFL